MRVFEELTDPWVVTLEPVDTAEVMCGLCRKRFTIALGMEQTVACDQCGRLIFLGDKGLV